MPLRLLGTIGSSVQKVSGAFESIATATGTGSSGTITFSSIPSTYQHLQIRGITRSDKASATENLELIVNSDTGSNYSYHRLSGNGSSALAAGSATQSYIFLGSTPAASTTSNILSAITIDILDYASTSKYKTLRAMAGMDSNGQYTPFIGLLSGLWQSTSAINSITLRYDGTNFTTQTTFALYGIKG